MQRDRHRGSNPLRSPFVRLLIGLVTLGCCYMLAVPPNGGVDEQDHLVRAAATVRGDLVGHGFRFAGDQVRVYDVPIQFKGPHNECWSRDPTIDASCMDFDVIPGELSFALNGYYPPTYFALVGWPSLVVEGFSAVRPIRLVSLAVCLALAVVALHLARRQHGTRGAAVAAVALTPTTFFLFGVVNPQAVEVAAAFAVWFAAPLVLRGAAARWERWAFAVAGVLLVSVRPLGSPFWFVIIAVSLVAHGIADPIRTALRNRVVAAVSVVAVAVTLASLAGGVGSLENEQYARSDSLLDTLSTSFTNQLSWFHDAVGRLGWLDITPPAVTQWVWSALLAAALVAIALAPARIRLAAALLAVSYWVLQVYTSYTQASSNGLNWQGRYGLALLIGLVALALATGAARARWVAPAVTAVAAAQFVSFYLALRRWTVGTDGPILFVFDTNWTPPLPAALLVVAALASSVLVASAVTPFRAPTTSPEQAP